MVVNEKSGKAARKSSSLLQSGAASSDAIQSSGFRRQHRSCVLGAARWDCRACMPLTWVSAGIRGWAAPLVQAVSGCGRVRDDRPATALMVASLSTGAPALIRVLLRIQAVNYPAA